MDVSEIRTAFLRSESLVERVRVFRSTRTTRIQMGETPVTLDVGAKIALHLVPLQAFDPSALYDVAGLRSNTSVYSRLYPIHSGISTHRHNFDGFLTYAKRSDEEAEGYVQVFRNGIIEAVDGSMLRTNRQSPNSIPSGLYEQELVKALPRYLAVQQTLGIDPPIIILLTLIGVRGYFMAVDQSRYFSDDQPIDRDLLDVPDTLAEHYDVNAAQLLRPLFDTVWNAAGWPRSMNYDERGSWRQDNR